MLIPSVILNDSTIDVWVQSDQYPVDAALSTLKPCSQIDYYPVSHIGWFRVCVIVLVKRCMGLVISLGGVTVGSKAVAC